MTNSNQAIRFLILMVMVFTYSSCSDSKPKQGEEAKLFSEAEEKIFKDISKILSDLPPPSVVPMTMQEIGAEFKNDLANDLENLDIYLVNPDKAALNLGTYAADMGYLIAYDKVQESMNHMEACQKLAENLGVSSAFDLDMVRKYEAAMDDHNKLIELLNETILKAEKRLGDSDQIANAGLVLTGSFVEGLYLAVTVVHQESKENRGSNNEKILEPLVRLILQQEQPLIDIVSLLKDIPANPIVTKMITELNILKILFDGDLAKINEEMLNNPDFIVTEEMLFDISLEVSRIRKGITD